MTPAPAGVQPPAAAAQQQQQQRLTLPDGHLNVGTHLPLLAGRYKYLSTLGEGVSSRVGAGNLHISDVVPPTLEGGVSSRVGFSCCSGHDVVPLPLPLCMCHAA